MEIKPYKLTRKRPAPTEYRKVNKELLDAILEDLRKGSTNKHAARANGITETHFYNIVNQGLCDVDHGLHDTLAAYLVKSLAKIEQDEVRSCLSDIRSNEKGHKGAEWILEHAHWRDFSANAAVLQISQEIEEVKRLLSQGDKENGEAHSENTQQTSEG